MSRRRKLLLHMAFGWINLTLTAPAVYLWLGLPLVLRQQGWSGTAIGLFQLAGLPAVFKLFLALPVERERNTATPCRRWFWLTGSGYLLTLLLLAVVDSQAPKPLLFLLILLAALCGTWADIPANTLALKRFPASERARAGSVRSAATFAGAILGGGALLLVQQAHGWAAPFLLLGLGLAASLILVGWLGEHDENRATETPPALSMWRGFLQQPGGRSWGVILLCYFPCVASAWVYLKPLLLDHGLAPAQVAWIAGIGGGGIGALTSLAMGFLPRQRLVGLLPLSAGLNVLSLLLLVAASSLASDLLLWLAVPLLACAMGASSALAFAWMMEFARPHCQAGDYGLQASLFTLGRISAAALAGMMLDTWGYTGMLAALALLATAVTLVAWRGSPSGGHASGY